MSEEIWKDVVGYEGCYQVSSFGRVRSLTRLVHTNYGTYIKSGRIMCQEKRQRGYMYVSLRANGKSKNYRVHRLVAIAFLKNPNNLEQIDHIDGNTSNNRVENLEWVSRETNIKRAVDMRIENRKLDTCVKSTDANNSCVDVNMSTVEPDVEKRCRRIRRRGGHRRRVLRSDGVLFESIAEAARSVNGRHNRVFEVLKHQRSSYKGYKFEYADKR